jgi:hypothetical protein
MFNPQSLLEIGSGDKLISYFALFINSILMEKNQLDSERRL